MAFETIENCGPAESETVPSSGIRVQGRRIAGRGGGLLTRYIKLTFGAELARKLVFKAEVVRIALACGSDRDAGKIRASVDMTGGGFTAKRNKRGHYALTINAASAEGLFALEFPAFTVADPKIVETMGQPPAAVFAASAEMLAAE